MLGRTQAMVSGGVITVDVDDRAHAEPLRLIAQDLDTDGAPQPVESVHEPDRDALSAGMVTSG